MQGAKQTYRRYHPITRGLQYVYLLVAWAFVLGIAAQVYIAGMFIFSSASWLEVHSALGWTLITSTLLLPVLAALGRFPGSLILLNVALIVLAIAQESLVTFLRRLHLPALEALHPLNALIIFLVAMMAAYRATRWVAASRRLEPAESLV
jgi:hypothetical protein